MSACFLTIFLPVRAQENAKTSSDYDQAAKFLWFNTNDKVFRNNVYPQWLADGKFYYSVSTANGREYVLIDPAKKTKQTSDSLKSLLPNLAESSRGNYSEVASPDGSKVAFIRDWNLWIRDTETSKEKQLTFDGVENFGYATDNAGWKHTDRPILLWSPDSKKIATFQQDQRHVSDMYLVKTKVGAPELQAWKYPLPQDQEIIKIHRVILEVENAKMIRLDMPADDRRGTLCDDISCSGAFDDNQWNADASKLMFVSSSRDHKSAKLRIADAATGKVTDIMEEKVATQYESGQGSINWQWLPETNEVIWYSERDDWGHLYLYDASSGKLKNQITTGEFVVTQMLKVDPKKRLIYFMANGREEGRDPYFAHFYSVTMDGKKLTLLTPENGNHSVNISPFGNYFVDNYSQPNVPAVSVLRDLTGKKRMDLETGDISKLIAAGWKAPQPITVKSRDGQWDLYGLMFTPTNLDESKKYPVVNYIYPGPQGGGVGSRSFSASRGDHQALAELGFVVVVIDGTCNPGRSKSFHDACYGNMADNTLEDQISGLKQLAERYPYLDLDRVGVWGHSGGGFATAAAMFRYPEFYKVGISESGNHDNRNYEDDWGERYIGLLTKSADGKDNYDAQANQNYAANLKGKLLIAHGNMDDNVPPYNSYLIVDALISANKDFDLIIFPHARHGFGKDSNYMTRRRWDYFVKHLQGVEPPAEYKLGR
jgi:dipeptidyl aminopeptidase/acylaminoacyl peptidase